MITREDITNQLIDGANESLRGITCPDCGSPIEYSYSERFGSFVVRCSCTEERMIKVFPAPDCVELFGLASVL